MEVEYRPAAKHASAMTDFYPDRRTLLRTTDETLYFTRAVVQGGKNLQMYYYLPKSCFDFLGESIRVFAVLRKSKRDPWPEHIALCPSVLEAVDVALDGRRFRNQSCATWRPTAKVKLNAFIMRSQEKYCRWVGIVFMDGYDAKASSFVQVCYTLLLPPVHQVMSK